MINIIQYLDILAMSEAVRGFSIHKKPDTVYMCHGPEQKGKVWGPMCEAIDVLDQEAGLGGSEGVNDAVESTLECMKGNVVEYVGGVRKKAHRVCQDQDPPIRTIHKHGRGRTAGKAAMDSRVLRHASVHQTGSVDDITGVAGTPVSLAHAASHDVSTLNAEDANTPGPCEARVCVHETDACDTMDIPEFLDIRCGQGEGSTGILALRELKEWVDSTDINEVKKKIGTLPFVLVGEKKLSFNKFEKSVSNAKKWRTSIFVSQSESQSGAKRQKRVSIKSYLDERMVKTR
jgi:hypothetical protein